MKAPPVRVAVVGMATAAALILLLGVAHVNRRQQIIHLGYELSQATEELSRVEEENRRLRLEKSALTNPERIRRLAESLGMSQPGPSQIRVIHVSPRPDEPASADNLGEHYQKSGYEKAVAERHGIGGRAVSEDALARARME